MGDRQKKIYEFIKIYMEKNMYPPSTRDIAKGVGLKSSSTVNGHLKRMRKNGFVDYQDSKPRTVILIGK